ncbi:MAG: SRPBCC domain-containing protein [Thermoproteota archaeon]|nr:SRPBCC domain-containing protein [Thermoproteota archaeon]
MKEIRSEIEIDSNPESVWEILTDFASYDQWNPFINRIVGLPRRGEKIDIHIETPGRKKRKYSPTITKVEEGRELRWAGKSSLPGFLNAEHIFIIEETQPGHVRFIQREVFDGLLTLLIRKGFDTDVRQGFAEMNEALKKRVEQPTY